MRLVTTINVGELWYGKHTLPTIRAYADRHRADFLELKVGEPGRYPWYLQVDFLKRFARQDHYTQLMMIDLDCLIRPDCEDLFDMVGNRLGLARDMGMPTVEVGGHLWEKYHEELRGRPPGIGAPYYNSGLLVAPLAVVRELAELLTSPMFNQPQHEMNIQFRGYRNRFEIPLAYNWMAPQLDCAREQKIVHFGGHKDLIPDFRF